MFPCGGRWRDQHPPTATNTTTTHIHYVCVLGVVCFGGWVRVARRATRPTHRSKQADADPYSCVVSVCLFLCGGRQRDQHPPTATNTTTTHIHYVCVLGCVCFGGWVRVARRATRPPQRSKQADADTNSCVASVCLFLCGGRRGTSTQTHTHTPSQHKVTTHMHYVCVLGGVCFGGWVRVARPIATLTRTVAWCLLLVSVWGGARTTNQNKQEQISYASEHLTKFVCVLGKGGGGQGFQGQGVGNRGVGVCVWGWPGTRVPGPGCGELGCGGMCVCVGGGGGGGGGLGGGGGGDGGGMLCVCVCVCVCGCVCGVNRFLRRVYKGPLLGSTFFGAVPTKGPF